MSGDSKERDKLRVQAEQLPARLCATWLSRPNPAQRIELTSADCITWHNIVCGPMRTMVDSDKIAIMRTHLHALNDILSDKNEQ